MGINDKIDEQHQDVRRAREVARSRNRHENEIVKAIQALRKESTRLRRLKKAAKEEGNEVAQERLADRIEENEANKERLVDQLDRVSRRSKAANEELRKEKKVLTRLKKRRKAIREAREEAKKGRLTKNFYVVEFNCREGGPVPEYMYDDLEHLCRVFLEPLRAQFGAAHVNSGHRWRFYNIKIGGATGSYHEYEIRKDNPAGDVTFANGTPAQWAAAARSIANRVGYGGVGQYNQSFFIHIDTGPRRDWWG